MKLLGLGLAFLCAAAPMANHAARDEAREGRPTEKGAAAVERRAQRERKFERTLARSVLKGTWQMTTFEGDRPKAPLGEARTDQYTIDKLSKAGGDYWIISARIQYADKDVTIPVTVRVTWAGETPIIVLDKMALPGLGTYSARVIVDGHFYAGTWHGVNYGGVLSGEIVKQEDEHKPAATTQPAADRD